jgi:hypothetical protein
MHVSAVLRPCFALSTRCSVSCPEEARSTPRLSAGVVSPNALLALGQHGHVRSQHGGQPKRATAATRRSKEQLRTPQAQQEALCDRRYKQPKVGTQGKLDIFIQQSRCAVLIIDHQLVIPSSRLFSLRITLFSLMLGPSIPSAAAAAKVDQTRRQ